MLNSFLASNHSLYSCAELFLTKSIERSPLGLKVQGALVILADCFEVHEDWFVWVDRIDWFDSVDERHAAATDWDRHFGVL